MGRRAKGAGIVALIALALSGCSQPPDGGVRLNADGTIDFIVCGGPETIVEVTYLGIERTPTFDGTTWRGTWTDPDRLPGQVVHYGDPGYTAEILLNPPAGWTDVVANGVYADREDLTVGEWVWFTSDPDWVPRRPCEGVSAEELQAP